MPLFKFGLALSGILVLITFIRYNYAATIIPRLTTEQIFKLHAVELRKVCSLKGIKWRNAHSLHKHLNKREMRILLLFPHQLCLPPPTQSHQVVYVKDLVNANLLASVYGFDLNEPISALKLRLRLKELPQDTLTHLLFKSAKDNIRWLLDHTPPTNIICWADDTPYTSLELTVADHLLSQFKLDQVDLSYVSLWNLVEITPKLNWAEVYQKTKIIQENITNQTSSIDDLLNSLDSETDYSRYISNTNLQETIARWKQELAQP